MLLAKLINSDSLGSYRSFSDDPQNGWNALYPIRDSGAAPLLTEWGSCSLIEYFIPTAIVVTRSLGLFWRRVRDVELADFLIKDAIQTDRDLELIIACRKSLEKGDRRR
jgi:hypothetical protein